MLKGIFERGAVKDAPYVIQNMYIINEISVR